MVELIVLFAVTTLLGWGCLGAAVGVVVSPETLDVDKIFSIIASVTLGLVFLSISAWMAFRSSLRKLWKPDQKASGAKDTSDTKTAS